MGIFPANRLTSDMSVEKLGENQLKMDMLGRISEYEKEQAPPFYSHCKYLYFTLPHKANIEIANPMFASYLVDLDQSGCPLYLGVHCV